MATIPGNDTGARRAGRIVGAAEPTPTETGLQPDPTGQDRAALAGRPEPTEVARLVVVSATCDVSATVTQTYGSRGHGTVHYSGSLAEFLADTHIGLPDRTPVVRFDKADLDTARAFSIGGPIREPSLPVNTVHRLSGDPRPYRGEPWQELGELTYVSLDVYLRCATQAGIVVEYTGVDPAHGGPDLTSGKKVMHLTLTGIDAGDSLCGLTRAEILHAGHRGAHAAYAPQWMLTATDTARFTREHPDNPNTNVCPDCQHVWNIIDNQ